MEEPINSSAGAKVITILAHELIGRDQPGIHNQAMMEFGALQCIPRSPLCQNCPLQDQCYALKKGQVDKLPVKDSETQTCERWFYFYILLCEGETIITRRNRDDIWKSLYQFPV